MTRILITGGAGFLGGRVARELLAAPVAIGGAPAQDVDELVVVDLAAPPDELARDPRVTARTGDLADALATVGEVDAVFHLAGVVSGAAEADFDLGMRVNVDGTRQLLEFCRGHTTPPVLAFTSSNAVHGSDPAIGPIGVIDDNSLPRPQSSYGFQKFIAEQLVADYTRRRFVRGRSVRPMTVSVRPGRPNAALSGFLSGIIREPLAGLRASCPVPADTAVALSSPRRTVAGILRAAQVDDATWGSSTAINLPALSTTPAQMARALDRVAGAGTSDLIDWESDPATETIVCGWAAHVRADRAAALGLDADPDVDSIIREYLAS